MKETGRSKFFDFYRKISELRNFVDMIDPTKKKMSSKIVSYKFRKFLIFRFFPGNQKEI
jgi:hypothetical protein